MSKFVIAYDVGTTGVKTCLFEIDKTIKLIADSIDGYNLYILPDGGAEQDTDEWWTAMCKTTNDVFSKTDVTPDQISGISFCSQMQGMVLVDKAGNAIRRPMSYMDQRAKEQIKKGIAYGPQIAGANIFKLIPALLATGAVSCSVKDPIWKYRWVEDNEPELFKKAYKMIDVKEYLIARATGNIIMTQDSAFGTLLYDIHKKDWSEKMCKLYGVHYEHLAPIIKSTDVAGKVTAKAAKELGLAEGTPVFGGGGDASLIGVGAGATALGDTHIYSGTSGWVSTVVDRSIVDTTAMIAAIVGAQDGKYNYFAEMETSGKCLQWVKDHLALDEIAIYTKHTTIAEDFENEYTNLYEYMSDCIEKVPAGCDGVVFTPWLHGNRCPFEDPLAKGMFFNIGLETGKTEMIRAVVEGICYHKRWMLETQAKKVNTSSAVRFVGGGALQTRTCQILSDILGRPVETVANPQNVGAVGAAAVIGVGLGIIPSLDNLKDYIPAIATFKPNLKNKAVYDRNFEVYKNMYKCNKENFHALNG